MSTASTHRSLEKRKPKAGPASAPPCPLDLLTPRQYEVLGWVAAGKTDAVIARILRCGLRTVHTHVGDILARLGLENRTCAGVLYVELGGRLPVLNPRP